MNKKITVSITFTLPADMVWDLQNLIDRMKSVIKQTITIHDGKLIKIEAIDEQ